MARGHISVSEMDTRELVEVSASGEPHHSTSIMEEPSWLSPGFRLGPQHRDEETAGREYPGSLPGGENWGQLD